MNPRWLLRAAVLAGLAACGDNLPGSNDILEQLAAIDGMKVEDVTDSVTSALPGYHYYELHYRQPADHDDPAGGFFDQYMTLSHRDVAAPLVLHTHGYSNPRRFRLTEPAVMLAANQLTVEHRFFAGSRPDPADWNDLDLEQAAADIHRVVTALRPLYPGAWISTGASKNGEAALYHRRFYPDDVAGTVAYVAPLMTSLFDPRSATILDGFGDARCRDALRTFQRAALERRAAIETRALRDDDHYGLIGVGRAAETAIVEAEWLFWQYAGAGSCNRIPATTADDDTLYEFLDDISPVSTYVDGEVLDTEPYYYQVLDELGYGTLDYDHLADLMRYDYEDLSAFMPTAPVPDYDPHPVQDVLAWIASSGGQILLIYGQWDPWTAAAVPLGAAQDSFSFTATGIGHWANIADLTPDEIAIATDRLSAWANAHAQPPTRPRHHSDDLDELRQERGLRPR